MATKIELGQVVYVQIDAKQKVVPGLLIEELINRTVSGTKTTYVVQVGVEKDQTMKFEEEKVFSSLKHAKDTLLQRFNVALDKLIENASILAKDWYGEKAAQQPIKEVVPKQTRKTEPPPRATRTPRHPSVPPDVSMNEDDDTESYGMPAPVATPEGYARVTMDDGTVVNVKLPNM